MVQADLKSVKHVMFGAGTTKLEGFSSIDISAELKPDLVADITNPDFPEGSFETIYASHVFEHLLPKPDQFASRWDFLIHVLRGWRKCLKAGGKLFIAVPDSQALARLILKYPEHTDIQKSLLDSVYGGARNAYDFHYSGFTYALLKSLLLEAGFTEVQPFDPFAEDESKHFLVGEPISLNLVALNGGDQNGLKSSLPAQVSPTTEDELTRFKRIADERMVTIFKIEKEAQEMRKRFQEVEIEAQGYFKVLQAEIDRLKNVLRHPIIAWVRRVIFKDPKYSL